jgi:hypothetical protein
MRQSYPYFPALWSFSIERRQTEHLLLPWSTGAFAVHAKNQTLEEPMSTLLKSLLVAGVCFTFGQSSPEPAAAFACGMCGNCLGGHENPFDVRGEAEGIHSGCIAVAGCPHPGCVETLRPGTRDFERMLVEVEAGAKEAPAALLRRHSATVVWNRERQALQLRAPCYGEAFMGHIPLTDAQQQHLSGD